MPQHRESSRLRLQPLRTLKNIAARYGQGASRKPSYPIGEPRPVMPVGKEGSCCNLNENQLGYLVVHRTNRPRATQPGQRPPWIASEGVSASDRITSGMNGDLLNRRQSNRRLRARLELAAIQGSLVLGVGLDRPEVFVGALQKIRETLLDSQ
jgi:hypothetical protein